MPRRPTLTKTQRQTAAGIDLIALCQTITQDGRIDDDEITALQQWLVENRASDLPAIAFLSQTVDQILADGKVTPEERSTLYKTIETVLPPDIREAVKGTRTNLERARKEEAKRAQQEAKAAVKEMMRAERELNGPIDRWNFMVAGATFEGRDRTISAYARQHQPAFLRRDRANLHSSNAIEVRLSNGMSIGYVPEDLALQLAPLLDGGHRYEAVITKILYGGRGPKPVVVATLYQPGATREGLLTEGEMLDSPPTGGATLLTPSEVDTMKACPFCAEEIQDAAVVCKHCGRDLVSGASNVQIVQPKKKTSLVTLGCVVVLALCGSGYVAFLLQGGTTPRAAASARPPATQAAAASGCQEHIELHSAAYVARELGKSEGWVVGNHRVNLWQNAGSQRGTKVGEMRAGSRAVIITRASGAYQVRSPLDKSIGWVGNAQVARTLHQDVKTFKACKP